MDTPASGRHRHERATTTPGRDLREGAIAALLALLVYVALGQHTFYKVDGHLYLGYVLNGERSYPRHFLYLPMVEWLRAATAPLGLTLYESARLLSALGTAVGVGIFHLASRRLGLSLAEARWTTLLCATSAPIVFFATIVEVHGSFVAFAALSALAAAHLAARPTPLRAVVFGASAALAFCAHSTGALLPAVYLPLLLVDGEDAPRRFRRALLPGAIVAVTALVGVLASPSAAAAIGVKFDLGHSGDFATDRAGVNVGALWRWRDTLRHEWLLPFLPMSFLTPILLLRRAARARAAWLLVAAGLYLVVAIMILGGEDERGAYLLPFVWPLALLVLRCLPHWRAVVLATQLALGVLAVRAHDDPAPPRAFAAGVEAAAAGAPIALLVGDELDLKVLLLDLPTAERVPLFELARLPAAAATDASKALVAKVNDLLAAGNAVLLSTLGADRITSHPLITPCGPDLLAALRATFALEPVSAGAFRGWRVRAR